MEKVAEVFKRFMSLIYAVVAVVFGSMVLHKYDMVYGKTIKFAILFGAGLMLVYWLLIYFYRELTSETKSVINGYCSSMVIVFSVVMWFMIERRWLYEDVCFCMMVFMIMLMGGATLDVKKVEKGCKCGGACSCKSTFGTGEVKCETKEEQEFVDIAEGKKTVEETEPVEKPVEKPTEEVEK